MNLLLILFLMNPAFARSHKKAAPSKPFPSKVRMTKVATCDVKDATKKVYVIKQWHLAPSTATKGFKEKYPQEKNQTAIYKMLEEGVKRKELQLIVSEGCEGPITSEFKESFNGWDFASLKAQGYQKNYDKILTLVPLKIKAKFGEQIEVECGDNDEKIRDGNLHLSNLRGWTGYYSRLMENKDKPEKFKDYADSAIELMKLPKDTPADKLLSSIKDSMRDDLDDFDTSLSERNDGFVKVLSDKKYTKAAIVIGGLHAADLKSKLEKAGLGCEVLEPPGYQREDEKLIQDFRAAIKDPKDTQSSKETIEKAPDALEKQKGDVAPKDQ